MVLQCTGRLFPNLDNYRVCKKELINLHTFQVQERCQQGKTLKPEINIYVCTNNVT